MNSSSAHFCSDQQRLLVRRIRVLGSAYSVTAENRDIKSMYWSLAISVPKPLTYSKSNTITGSCSVNLEYPIFITSAVDLLVILFNKTLSGSGPLVHSYQGAHSRGAIDTLMMLTE